MNGSPAVEVNRVAHAYAKRRALDDVSLGVAAGEIFAFLGPNGGGKTTLFRLLSTLMPIQQGEIRILGHDIRTATAAIRRLVGTVFQAPSLDKQLSVAENLRCQGHLYGMAGAELRVRQQELTERFGLADRVGDRAASLSGGLRRRVELAKGMLHRPRLLLLDEPSTGLDPAVRGEVWKYLDQLRREEGVTVALTTHLLEEAEKADRLAILDEGRVVALDTPDRLRAELGDDVVTMVARQPAALADEVRGRFELSPQVVDSQVRLQVAKGHTWIARLVEAFPGRIDSISLGKPTLEDVFIARTGHRFYQPNAATAGD